MNGIRGFLLILMILIAGCNVQQLPDVVNPQKPDDPVVLVVPAESFFKGLAKWIEAKRISNPREMSAIINQLVATKQLSQVDAAKLDTRFPNMPKNNSAFTADDIAFLKSLK